MNIKTKVTKIIETKAYNSRDRIEFEPVNDIRKGILSIKLKQLKDEKGIELKKGDEIELEDDFIRYKLICRNEVIGKASKLKMYGTTSQQENL